MFRILSTRFTSSQENNDLVDSSKAQIISIHWIYLHTPGTFDSKDKDTGNVISGAGMINETPLQNVDKKKFLGKITINEIKKKQLEQISILTE